MKTLLKLTLATTLVCALPVWACTPEEATAKREQLAKEVAKLTQQNPAKAKEINAELQKMDCTRKGIDLFMNIAIKHHSNKSVPFFDK
jgi:hypothetical protein